MNKRYTIGVIVLIAAVVVLFLLYAPVMVEPETDPLPPGEDGVIEGPANEGVANEDVIEGLANEDDLIEDPEPLPDAGIVREGDQEMGHQGVRGPE